MTELDRAMYPRAATVSAKTRPIRVPKRATKSNQLIRMLGTKAGADVAAIGRRLGWQPHTVRAALSGLRKAGHVVEKGAPYTGKPPRYRIVAGTESCGSEAKPDAE